MYVASPPGFRSDCRCTGVGPSILVSLSPLCLLGACLLLLLSDREVQSRPQRPLRRRQEFRDDEAVEHPLQSGVNLAARRFFHSASSHCLACIFVLSLYFVYYFILCHHHHHHHHHSIFSRPRRHCDVHSPTRTRARAFWCSFIPCRRRAAACTAAAWVLLWSSVAWPEFLLSERDEGATPYHMHSLCAISSASAKVAAP